MKLMRQGLYMQEAYAAVSELSRKRRREHYSDPDDDSGSEGSEDDSHWEYSNGRQSSGSQWEGSEEDESQSEGSEDTSQSEDSESSTGAWDLLGGHFYLGTSGWQFSDWKENVYPATLKKKDWFQEYSSHLNSVEENRPFQCMPSTASVQKLNEQANGVRGFKYAMRFSKYGSHTKKLLDPQATIGPFAYNLRALGKRLGPVLVQLPPNWKMNPSDSPARLDAFLRARPKDAKWAIELRHESWLCEPIFSILRRRNVALCIHDNVDVEKHPQMLTADWTYVLFHGPRSEGVNTWSEGYGGEELGGRADWIRKVLKQGKDVYAYFRNHNEGHAFHDALKLRARVFQPKESKPKKQRGR